eukprot:m.90593 g.90593  ORF g.90593 m.90593 type:complete len:106 (+) comp12918_c0_seq1:140-457(+)
MFLAILFGPLVHVVTCIMMTIHVWKAYAAAPEPTTAPPPPPPAQPGIANATALYDFPGTNDGELAMTANESLVVMEDDGSGWALVRNASMQQGYVPSTYINQSAA